MKRWYIVTLILIGFAVLSNCNTKSTNSQVNSAEEMRTLTNAVMLAMELHKHELQTIANYLTTDSSNVVEHDKDTKKMKEHLMLLSQLLGLVDDRIKRIETQLERIQRTLNQR